MAKMTPLERARQNERLANEALAQGNIAAAKAYSANISQQLVQNSGSLPGVYNVGTRVNAAVNAATQAAEAVPASSPAAPSATQPSSPSVSTPSVIQPVISYTAPSPAPPPIPPLPSFTRMTAPDKNIKPAPSDIIKFDDSSVGIALIRDLLFEDIGAVELANISRTDLIDGQEVMYSPIKNLSSVRREFNPNNIIATSYATDFFSRFGIDLISRGIYEPYFDEDGNLIVEIETVGDGEEIQVQVLSSGTISVIEEL